MYTERWISHGKCLSGQSAENCAGRLAQRHHALLPTHVHASNGWAPGNIVLCQPLISFPHPYLSRVHSCPPVLPPLHLLAMDELLLYLDVTRRATNPTLALRQRAMGAAVTSSPLFSPPHAKPQSWHRMPCRLHSIEKFVRLRPVHFKPESLAHSKIRVEIQ